MQKAPTQVTEHQNIKELALNKPLCQDQGHQLSDNVQNRLSQEIDYNNKACKNMKWIPPNTKPALWE